MRNQDLEELMLELAREEELEEKHGLCECGNHMSEEQAETYGVCRDCC